MDIQEYTEDLEYILEDMFEWNGDEADDLRGWDDFSDWPEFEDED